MRYLVPVDGSQSALNAFWWVANHARSGEDHVYLLHLYKVDVHCTDSSYRNLRRHGETLLRRLGRKLKQRGVAKTLILGKGSTKKKIIKRAKDFQVDLIVMGRRGMSHAKRLYMGSVSQHVIEHAPCPVLLIKE